MKTKIELLKLVSEMKIDEILEFHSECEDFINKIYTFIKYTYPDNEYLINKFKKFLDEQ